MSLELLTLFGAGFYGLTSLYSTLFWLRNRDGRQRVSFAGVCVGLSLLSVANLLILTSEHDLLGTRMAHVALAVASASFVDFMSTVSDQPRWVTRGAYAGSFGVLALLVVGQMVSPEPVDALLRLGTGPMTVPHGTTLAGKLVSISAAGFSLVACTLAMRQARALPRRKDGRLRESQVFALTLLPTSLIVAHDALCLLEVVESSLWVPIAALPMSFTILTIFLRRMIRISAKLMERTEALHKMHRDLRSTQRRLIHRQQLAAVGELSAVIAHEVRNPLAVIKNAVAGLRRQALRAEDRQTLLNILGEETQRLTRLMHDLLAYARPVTPRRRPLDARSLLERVVARAVTEGTEIHYALDEDQTIHGDPELLRHAFVNIVENAVQAMPEGGALNLCVLDETLDLGAGAEPCVRVSFQDTGHGMAHDVLSKAPSPFYTTRPSGTGLGLAIVERVLHSHGGLLSIESVSGVGTSVHCILPRVHRRTAGTEAPFRARVT